VENRSGILRFLFENETSINASKLIQRIHMDNDDIISTLNDLIDTCKDGEASYNTCVADAKERHSNLQTMFADLEHGCAVAATELQGLVRSAGGHARTDSSVGGTMHRSWVNLKTAIAGKSDEAVLIECEQGEDSAARRYAVALERDFPPSIRMVIERQYQGVLVNHQQIKTLRDQMKVEA
jgi:uncharacterized protein (TIGR02284 family)